MVTAHICNKTNRLRRVIMRFGVSKDIITPIKPTMLSCSGEFFEKYKEIHDDIFVRCIVFDDGNSKTVLMSFDLLFHDRALKDKISKYAEDRYGIKRSAVVVTYTHTHISAAVPSYNLHNPLTTDEEYEKLLENRALNCLDRAMHTMFSGTVEYGSFDADFNISRRGKVNGEYQIYPNFDYEHDTEYFVLTIKDLNGRIRSILANYPCHPVFYPTKTELSGEFPARLSHLLETKYYGCVALYTQSCAGDVRPRPTVLQNADGSFAWGRLSFEDIDAFANQMCQSICDFHSNNLSKKIQLSINSVEFVISLPLDEQPLSVFEDMLEKETRYSPMSDGNANYYNAKYIVEKGYDALTNKVELFCQIIKLCDCLYIATVGGEPCFGVKKIIKKVFEGKDVCLIGYTDNCAYIVDDKLLQEGGYEPGSFIEYCLKGPFKRGVDELYSNGFKEALSGI